MSSTRQLTIVTTEVFDLRMDQLRMEAFPAEQWGATSADDYDALSTHLCLICDGGMAAYGRLTPARYGCFRGKFGEEAPLPPPAQSIDLGRIAVAIEHRGHSLSELVVVRALILAQAMGYHYVVGSCEPESNFRPLLHKLGFDAQGAPVQARYNTLDIVLQPLVASSSTHATRWRDHWERLLVRFEGDGYVLSADHQVIP